MFRALDPKQFEAFFRRWVSQIVPAATPPGQMAIDGKTIRGSADGVRRPAHIVSALSTELGIVFGQERVDEKSNEITAIPGLVQRAEEIHGAPFPLSLDRLGRILKAHGFSFKRTRMSLKKTATRNDLPPVPTNLPV